MTMDTAVMTVRRPEPDDPAVARAASVLRRGGLVALPTETVYGLAANALDSVAVERIFKAKGRPSDNPLIVHIASLNELPPLVGWIPDQAELLAGRFWPGPLTLVLPRSEKVPRIVSAGLDTVAVRMPSHPVARAVIRACGLPLAAPSANLSGRPSPTTAEHCLQDLAGRVELILDAGSCDVGVESTVLSLTGDVPRLLRPGAVTLEELRETLEVVEADRSIRLKVEGDTPVQSPGMKYAHYRPDAQVILIHGSWKQYAEYVGSKAADGVYGLVFDEELNTCPIPSVNYGGRDDPAEQARNLFAALRNLDEKGAKRVLARAPSSEGIGMAVYNRLIRAAGFEEIWL